MRFRHHVKSIILPYSTLFRSERREAWAGERVLATTARGQRAEARVTATLLCTSQPSPVLTCTKPSAPWPRDSGTHTQAGGPAVDGQQHPGGGTVAGGGEVAVRLGDLLGLDQPAMRLAGLEGLALGDRIVGRLQQPSHPG